MISIEVARELLMLKMIVIGLVVALVGVGFLAAVGFKEFLNARKRKNAIKKGYIQLIFIRKNGSLVRKLIKPESPNTIHIDGQTYLLDDMSKKVDWDGIPTWIYYEGKPAPFDIPDNSPFLSAAHLYKIIQTEAAAMRSPIEKYFKTILIAIIGLFGLILLLGMGGVH